MELTDTERVYLRLLSEGQTFEEMALELDWTVEEVDRFGTEFFDRVFRQGIN
ncbi:MAG TPA: hypothetical protein VFO39_18610 [Candidatus Sulfotelmatobacter sp.]|nr:hypothetical protein [Candidatus Sulfotelmatobacter sp.]